MTSNREGEQRGPPPNVLASVAASCALSPEVNLMIDAYVLAKYSRQTRLGVSLENFAEDRKRSLQREVLWLLQRHAEGTWRGLWWMMGCCGK